MRRIAGTTTRLIIRHVRARGGDIAVAAMLHAAGEARPVTELEDETTWSSYDEVIALLEAAAAVLEDPGVGRRIGEDAISQRIGTPIVTLLRTFGSPAHLCRNVGRISAKFGRVGTWQVVEVGGNRATLEFRIDEALVRNRIHCDYTVGLLTQIPLLFGLPPATVVHDECQARGHEACTYEVAWRRHSRMPWRARRFHADWLEIQLATLTAQLDDLQSAAADLVSADDVDTVLSRIATRAATAVRAPSYVLAVRAVGDGTTSVHHHGVGKAEAEALAEDLLADDPVHELGSRLVVDVVSARRHYGRLAAVYDDRDDGFLPQEHRVLAAYARHAAAALDVAHALADARLRGETAEALLSLAHSLADVTTVDEVCQRLVTTVPVIADADRAAVLLWDPGTETLRMVARGDRGAEGPFDDGGGFTIAMDDTPALEEMLRQRGPTLVEKDGTDPFLRARLLSSGTAGAAIVPLQARGEFLGIVSASWTHDDDPRRSAPGIMDRLCGVADLAATALENGRLLEHVRHQALHDPLTGVANQVLFEDRLSHELAAAARFGARVAVLFLDLDRFKAVNDTLGHAAGDELLCRVADRLTETVRASDTVGRLGGDEFTVLLPGLAATEEATALAAKVLDALRRPFPVNGQELTVSASIGVAVHPDDGDTPDGLLELADLAMYRAKQLGRDTYQLASHAEGAPA